MILKKYSNAQESTDICKYENATISEHARLETLTAIAKLKTGF